jgi:hypothetical protein
MARAIGVDVGGTKVAVASLEDGVLGEVRMRPTVKDSPEALVDQLVEAIQEAGDADAVGIGVPSVIDAAKGMAMSSVNIPLQHVPLRDILGKRLGIPVHVDNDASVAALSEALGDDGAIIAQSVVMFTVGTGVGGASIAARPARRPSSATRSSSPTPPAARPNLTASPSRARWSATPPAARWTGWPRSAVSSTDAARWPPPSAATRRASSACASSASGSGSRSRARSTASIPSSS